MKINRTTQEMLIENLIENEQALNKKLSNGEYHFDLAVQIQKNAILYDGLLKVGGIDDEANHISPLEK